MTSLFDPTNEDLRKKVIHKYLPDIRSFVKPLNTFPPNLSVFSQEELSNREGMEWLKSVTCSLVAPETKDLEAQQYQLSCFFDTLRDNASVLKKEFSECFSTDYEDSSFLALDLETTGLDTRVIYDYNKKICPKVKIVGVALATDNQTGYYLPVRHTEEDGVLNWDYALICKFLQRVVDSFLVVYHHAQYDKEVLSLNGVEPRQFPYFLDTMVLHYLQDVNIKSHGLKEISETLGRKMIEISQLFSETGVKTKGHICFDRLCATTANVYACSDAMNTLNILFHLMQIPREENVFVQQPVPLKIDHKMIDVLRVMYRSGFPVNLEYSILACKDLINRLILLEKTIFEFVGKKFNIASSQQVSKILFDEFKVPVLPEMERGKPTKSNPEGLYSTAADILEALYKKYPDYPLLEYIVQYRQLEHAFSTILAKFITNSFVDSVLPYTRSQVQYSTTVAPTGRLSSASNGGREQILVKETDKGNITYTHDLGDWSAGVNTQAISKDEGMKLPAKKILKLPPGAELLDNPYTEEVELEFVKKIAQI